MNPRDIVAIVVTVGLMTLLVCGLFLSFFYNPDPETVELELGFWEGIAGMFAGLISGYVLGNRSDNDKSKEADNDKPE